MKAMLTLRIEHTWSCSTASGQQLTCMQMGSCSQRNYDMVITNKHKRSTTYNLQQSICMWEYPCRSVPSIKSMSVWKPRQDLKVLEVYVNGIINLSSDSVQPSSVAHLEQESDLLW